MRTLRQIPLSSTPTSLSGRHARRHSVIPNEPSPNFGHLASAPALALPPVGPPNLFSQTNPILPATLRKRTSYLPTNEPDFGCVPQPSRIRQAAPHPES